MKLSVTTEEQRRVVKSWLGSGSINLFGMQFSGKDTQCNRLAAWLDGPIVGGGDILRRRTDIPGHVRTIVERGELAPIEDFLAIVTPYLGQPAFEGRPLILSAVGRYHGEEPGIMQAAEGAGHPMRVVVLLELDEATVWERWRLMEQRGDRETRVDDAKEGLEVRLKEFETKTLPVLAYYRERGLLESVDGRQDPDGVEAAILATLYDRALRAAG